MIEARPSHDLEPWASDTRPDDLPRCHVEEVSDSDCAYEVVQNGTMDGENGSTPHGSWDPRKQIWESNRAVKMENLGDVAAIDPWLSNGRNDFRSLEQIVAGAVDPGMSDREKALSLYNLEINHRFHAHCGDEDGTDPVKLFNIYGFTTCGHDAICLAGLWRRAGLERRPAPALGHVITQVYYNDAWHLMDGDMQCVYLNRDNHTVASLREIAHDHDLVKRTHAEGLLRHDGRAGNEWEAALYVYEGEAEGTRDAAGSHTMSMALRPGEAITWRWGQLTPAKYHGKDDIAANFGEEHERTICNGIWEYQPRLHDERWEYGAWEIDGLTRTLTGIAAIDGGTGSITWRMRSPYAFVGGNLDINGEDYGFSISWDGEEWIELNSDLDPFFPPEGAARYYYFLRCTLAGNARLSALRIENDIQMAPLALPGMRVGVNRFRYTDKSGPDRRVRLTHWWVERSTFSPPSAPRVPLYPLDGGECEGTQIAFRWDRPDDSGSGDLSDYQFELSEYADMRWPLSSNFRKLISLTADRGRRRYTLPLPGLLAPDRKYFWRVRAQNDAGIWGPWSNTWHFVPRAPSPPVDVEIIFDKDDLTGTLRWKAGPTGRRPASYRIYGSDEKGFSVNDEEYPVMRKYAGDWRGACLNGRFPANFLAETEDCEMAVVAEGIQAPGANRAFYRVVAVDEHGNRSWSSEYVSAPRPFIYSTPVREGRVGEVYAYQAETIKSLEDLRYRPVTREKVKDFWPEEEWDEILNGPPWNLQVVSFWNSEHPRYAIECGPDWLTVDEETGLLSGTPEKTGDTKVVVAVTLHRGEDELDLERLNWGQREVVSQRQEVQGPATQTYTLRIRE